MKIENSPPLRIRAALYIRVSTEEQVLHGHGNQFLQKG